MNKRTSLFCWNVSDGEKKIDKMTTEMWRTDFTQNWPIWLQRWHFQTYLIQIFLLRSSIGACHTIIHNLSWKLGKFQLLFYGHKIKNFGSEGRAVSRIGVHPKLFIFQTLYNLPSSGGIFLALTIPGYLLAGIHYPKVQDLNVFYLYIGELRYCLYICLFVPISFCLSVHQYCQFIHLYFLLVCLLSFDLSVCLSFPLSVRPYAYLYEMFVER